jgi:hypothetical protein
MAERDICGWFGGWAGGDDLPAPLPFDRDHGDEGSDARRIMVLKAKYIVPLRAILT